LSLIIITKKEYCSHGSIIIYLLPGMTKLEFLQTDAAVNKGNSGGPIFNLNGEVIGIVSYILSESGGFQGLGFAVSSNVAKELLLEQHSFWTGIESNLISSEFAKILNVPQGGGVLVQRVVSNSPLGKAGVLGGKYVTSIEGEEFILGGDIILAIDGLATTTVEEIIGSLQLAICKNVEL